MKAVCEDLIAQAALSITNTLRTFLTQSSQYLATKSASSTTPVDLTAQPWAVPEEVKRLHDTFVAEGGEGGMEGGLAEVLAKLNTWLSDKRAVAVLVPPIQVRSLTYLAP